ncbi:MAG: hypothetical protein E7590_04330 [Ruminococcaceae bacterium]|nr:hypothetical protein [Oscillospiraceae bacterium]
MMNKKAIAATSVLGALAVAGTVGLVMSSKKSSPARMAKKTGKVMNAVGQKMQSVARSMTGS